ncbi:hypothetical protein NCCP2716_27680 [Sporosarcina sp. NCCP-2716]|uniref:DUF1073 domain-containing protein n=1 Tax=Sporosarcina sp. NCCP-2716 TaxID=2943679 RepID=UPI00204142F2|nr:anti-CBASS Acb1 family protein [Sporosarcina sp. NCCP-2716]GKV70270.1 hypothetical protein NCCP2716_27680 [Sporosarcina sp. NCCP-2716]
MRTIDRARKQMRTDFMAAPGKGYGKDALSRQEPGFRRGLTDADISEMYATNRIVQNIIEIPAEDMTRNWFTLRMDDEKLKRNIMSKLADLNAREAFKKMRVFERLRGDGFISLGVTQSSQFQLSDRLDETKLKRVDYIHAFSGQKVTDFILNDDMFSPQFGQVETFKMKRRNNNGIILPNNGETLVHSSRLLHDQSRRLEDEHRGQSLLEPLYDIITVLDTSLWSVGQILYDYAFKIYKSEGIEDMNPEEKNELSMLMDYMFRTEALAIIGSKEELKKESTNTAGLKDMLDYTWDMLSAAARMPKSVIKGQEAGTITGAQYDVMNYYVRIAAHQENELKPNLERLIRLLMMAEDELGGRIDPNSLEWEIKFNPLWQVDPKTDAEIRKIQAQTDEIYLKGGVLLTDELRETRFGQFGLTDEMKYSGDAEDLERIAREVYSAWEENGSHG